MWKIISLDGLTYLQNTERIHQPLMKPGVGSTNTHRPSHTHPKGSTRCLYCSIYFILLSLTIYTHTHTHFQFFPFVIFAGIFICIDYYEPCPCVHVCVWTAKSQMMIMTTTHLFGVFLLFLFILFHCSPSPHHTCSTARALNLPYSIVMHHIHPPTSIVCPTVDFHTSCHARSIYVKSVITVI